MTDRKHKAKNDEKLVSQKISRQCRLRQTQREKIMTAHE